MARREGHSLAKIVSGGQTGVDRGALDAALKNGFPCGGWCPAGRLAEDGPIAACYPLEELVGGDYADRTRRNVEDSDGTVILVDGAPSAGTRLTVDSCRQLGRPLLRIEARHGSPARSASSIRQFIQANEIRTLNVAGPRASEWPDAYSHARETFTLLLESL